MKQNYKIRIIFLGCLVFGLLSVGFLVSPARVFADAAKDESCVSSSDCGSPLFCDPNSGNTCQTVISGSPCIAISDCYTSKTGLTCVNSQCIVPTAGANNPNQYPIGQPKDGGSCGTTDQNVIKQIQGIVGVTQDGICGTNTITGIQRYQQGQGLTDDGIVGPQTASAMGLSSTSGTTPPANTPPSNSTACPTGLTNVNGLCLPPSQYTTGIAGSTTLSGFIITIIKILLSFAGIIAVVMLVIGGYWYMAAGGNEETAEKGKKTIINFVLGLVVIILAYTIVTIIAATLTGADKLLQ